MMLSVFWDVLLLLLSMVSTVGVFFFIEKRWPAKARMPHNEIIGWQINILGTVYAIILGFMLNSTWTGFQAAKQNVGAEATALVNVARLGHGLSPSQANALWSLTRAYADVVTTQEWPAMQDSRFVPESHLLIEKMWKLLSEVQPASATQQAAQSEALAQLVTLTDHRRARRVELTDQLPAIQWVVLDAGGALLVLCCCLFGAHQVKLHLFLVMVLTFLLTLLLLTVAAIDRPFQGWLHVPVEAFQGAVTTLSEP